ncbi:hypothetical protein KZZ52_58765 [Dactylosporangium sp. AC04546]|uniref:hypothetical protein n=1 Tax=Dactylosporangium sp. AC04546 TaxID=2862460 RepID=UPI001EE0EA78|nr:hypothetical protein [Dactylosporangium sp. AC04546]WVK83636.1 hypothetical protein KZZ52_58765 [Dactylosporangium sp. AC04546]
MIRTRLPWLLINLGVAGKGKTDCGDHEWYNAGGGVAHCYHCEVGQKPYDPAEFIQGFRAAS